MEIWLKRNSYNKYTSIGETSTTIEVSDVDFEDGSPTDVKIDYLQTKFVFAKFTVQVKILNVVEYKQKKETGHYN